MGDYNFQKDLLRSKSGTRKIIKILEKSGYQFISEHDGKEYDLKFHPPNSEKTIKIEVKEDFYCARSGNVALEFHSRGVDSGIAVSKADYYIYIIHTNKGIKRFIFKTSKLKKMIKDKKYFRTVCGGDWKSNTYNYLFEYDVFITCGESIG